MFISSFYNNLVSSMVAFKTFKNNGNLKLTGRVSLFLNFIWWISFIGSCLLFTYRQLNWSFFNFDVELIFRILGLSALIDYATIVFMHFMRRKTNGYFRALKEKGIYAQTMKEFIFSVAIGTISTIAFGVVVSIMLAFEKLTMFICIGLCMQIPYFVTNIIETCLISAKYGQKEAGQISEDTLYEYQIKSEKIENIVLAILELAMLVFFVYFGAIPFCKGGGLNAIREKADEIITVNKDILFGSGGLVGAAIAGLGLIVKIVGSVRNKRNR